ncbi:MAG: sulfatase-like hydrolase/transferase [Verrucomicrobiota bacterium]
MRFLLLSLLAFSGAAVADAKPDKPMNVLFIAADDMNCDLGVYGHPEVKTPHLDRLAKMGVRFDNAYCQQPLCGPSRASVMTGLRPDTLDMHTLAHDMREKNPDVVTMGQLFKQNGYFSYRSGKIYHYGNPTMIGTDANDDPATWTERSNPAGIDKTRESEIINHGPGKGLGISMAWWDPVSKDEEHTDGMVASDVIAQIDKHGDKPFFLAAGFFNPHCPYVAPKKYFDLYPLEDISIPDLKEAKEDLKDVPPMAIQRDTKNWPFYFKDITVEEARRCKQAYFACNTFVDAQVGRLIDALEARDLLDNTVIVFWSDHGYFLGEKGLWYKRKAFERSARMPLIIAAPGLTKGGHSAKPVELLDLYPTLAELCGLAAPKELEGESLVPLLKDPNAKSWTKPAVTQIWHSRSAWGYSIRTERWRYTEWLEGEAGRELYDHASDPEEVTNLAEEPEHQERIAELSAQLKPYQELGPNKVSNSVISDSGQLKQLATGMKFTEGPVWLPKEELLVFSDIPNSKLMSWSEKKKELGVYREESFQTNGNLLDLDGNLLSCRHGARDLALTDLKTGEVEILATQTDGKKFNSPNDVAVKSDGTLWFTDPPWGLKGREKELEHHGIYRLDPDGSVHLLSTELAMPNGIVFSTDEKLLYVADTGGHDSVSIESLRDAPAKVYIFRVGDDNSISMTEDSLPVRSDGMCVDVLGNVYTTTHQGVEIFDKDHQPVAVVPTPEGAANACFGGKDLKTLYITARKSLYSIRTKNKGHITKRK